MAAQEQPLSPDLQRFQRLLESSNDVWENPNNAGPNLDGLAGWRLEKILDLDSNIPEIPITLPWES